MNIDKMIEKLDEVSMFWDESTYAQRDNVISLLREILLAGKEPLPKELKIGGYQELALRLVESNKRIGELEAKLGGKVRIEELERRVAELEHCLALSGVKAFQKKDAPATYAEGYAQGRFDEEHKHMDGVTEKERRIYEHGKAYKGEKKDATEAVNMYSDIEDIPVHKMINDTAKMMMGKETPAVDDVFMNAKNPFKPKANDVEFCDDCKSYHKWNKPVTSDDFPECKQEEKEQTLEDKVRSLMMKEYGVSDIFCKEMVELVRSHSDKSTIRISRQLAQNWFEKNSFDMNSPSGKLHKEIKQALSGK